MTLKKITLSMVLISFFSFNANAALDVSSIKLELAKLEGSKDKTTGLAKCQELMAKISEEEKSGPNSAELYTWKGIVLAKIAHYNAPNPKALSLAKEARASLEKAISIDEKNSDAAALNALGIIYHRVPKFISFRDDKKSEEYFKKAVQTSSNLDTNWRYGEFLIETGRKAQGVEMLKTALAKLNPAKPDEKIKEKIIQNLIKQNESN